MGEFSGRTHNLVQIQHSHGAIQFMAPERPVPREIWPPDGDFVNRADDLGWLRGQRGRIVVLAGMPGIGKSALARMFADEQRDRFPGGQLQVDVGHFTADGVVDVSGMVGACLSALGIADEFQPPSLGERVHRFRSRTSERSFLVLVENATEPAQVTALTPANGLVLVTTQGDLSELELDGAAFRTLRTLDEEHSLALFSAASRDAPPQAGDLVTYAGGHPLAIRVLAGRTNRLHDVSVTELAAELADDRRRLQAMALGGRRVSAVFTASYERLPPDVRRLYRRLALLPGADFAVDAAASVATGGEVRPQLSALADAHLLERRPDGRYGFHDLVRIHARELAEGDPLEQREAALAQAVRHYLVHAAFADRAKMGSRSRIADHSVLLAGAVDPFTPIGKGRDASADPARQSAESATGWFLAERANLRAVVTAAHDAGLHEECWQLAEALVAFYYNHRFLGEWTAVSAIGEASARTVGARRAEARLATAVSRAYTNMRDPARASAALDRAWELASDENDPVLTASIWEFRGRLLELTDRPAALRAYERARVLNAGAAEWRGVALCLLWNACTLAELGQLREAAETLSDVVMRFEDLPDQRMAGRARIALAGVLAKLGRTDEARVLLESSLPDASGTHYEAEARELLADLSADADTALAHLRRAWKIYSEEGNPRADDLLSP